MPIDDQLFWVDLMALAKIGVTPRSGVCRLALATEDACGRAWFAAKAKNIGMMVRTDAIGNQFARLQGSDPALPPVLVGSHLDTQPSGGKSDGAFGVVAGSAVVEAISNSGDSGRRSVEVVAWTNEEGSRFLPVMAGSGYVAGVHALSDVLARCDRDGMVFGQALMTSARRAMRCRAPSTPISRPISSKGRYSKVRGR